MTKTTILTQKKTKQNKQTKTHKKVLSVMAQCKGGSKDPNENDKNKCFDQKITKEITECNQMKDVWVHVYSENDKINDFNENCADFKSLSAMG